MNGSVVTISLTHTLNVGFSPVSSGLTGGCREDETEVVGLVAIDGVLGQRALSPCVGAAYAVDVEVDVDVDERASRHFVGMKRSEVFVAVVPCADAKRLKSVDADDCGWRVPGRPSPRWLRRGWWSRHR